VPIIGFGEGAGLKNPVTEPKRSPNPKRPLAHFYSAAWLQYFLNRSNARSSLPITPCAPWRQPHPIRLHPIVRLHIIINIASSSRRPSGHRPASHRLQAVSILGYVFSEFATLREIRVKPFPSLFKISLYPPLG
jgi:hypothetical protein